MAVVLYVDVVVLTQQLLDRLFLRDIVFEWDNHLAVIRFNKLFNFLLDFE